MFSFNLESDVPDHDDPPGCMYVLSEPYPIVIYLEEDEAEPPDPAVDPHAHGQQDPLELEAAALAPHEDRPLDYSLRERS